MFWGLSWADVVEKLPSGQDQLGAQTAWPSEFPPPSLPNRSSILHWWPKPLAPTAQAPRLLPFEQAPPGPDGQQPAAADGLPAKPLRALVAGPWPTNFDPGPARPPPRFTHRSQARS